MTASSLARAIGAGIAAVVISMATVNPLWAGTIGQSGQALHTDRINAQFERVAESCTEAKKDICTRYKKKCDEGQEFPSPRECEYQRNLCIRDGCGW
jgi:hypothetical protein